MTSCHECRGEEQHKMSCSHRPDQRNNQRIYIKGTDGALDKLVEWGMACKKDFDQRIHAVDYQQTCINGTDTLTIDERKELENLRVWWQRVALNEGRTFDQESALATVTEVRRLFDGHWYFSVGEMLDAAISRWSAPCTSDATRIRDAGVMPESEAAQKVVDGMLRESRPSDTQADGEDWAACAGSGSAEFAPRPNKVPAEMSMAAYLLSPAEGTRLAEEHGRCRIVDDKGQVRLIISSHRATEDLLEDSHSSDARNGEDCGSCPYAPRTGDAQPTAERLIWRAAENLAGRHDDLDLLKDLRAWLAESERPSFDSAILVVEEANRSLADEVRRLLRQLANLEEVAAEAERMRDESDEKLLVHAPVKYRTIKNPTDSYGYGWNHALDAVYHGVQHGPERGTADARPCPECGTTAGSELSCPSCTNVRHMQRRERDQSDASVPNAVPLFSGAATTPANEGVGPAVAVGSEPGGSARGAPRPRCATPNASIAVCGCAAWQDNDATELSDRDRQVIGVTSDAERGRAFIGEPGHRQAVTPSSRPASPTPGGKERP